MVIKNFKELGNSDQKRKSGGEQMKKEVKPVCASHMHFSDKRGRCVIDGLENFNSRSKSAPNLRFKKTGGD